MLAHKTTPALASAAVGVVTGLRDLSVLSQRVLLPGAALISALLNDLLLSLTNTAALGANATEAAGLQRLAPAGATAASTAADTPALASMPICVTSLIMPGDALVVTAAITRLPSAVERPASRAHPSLAKLVPTLLS